MISDTSTVDPASDLLQREREDAMSAAREAVAAEAAAVSVLILADPTAAILVSPYVRDGCHVVPVSENGAIDDDIALAIVHGDRDTPIYTWCSRDHDGARLTRLLHDSVSITGHVTLVDPARWTGATPSFDDVLAGATPEKPPAIRKPPAPGGGLQKPSPNASHDGYEVTSGKAATRLLLAHPDRLLVVTDDQQVLSDLYVIGDNGIWIRGDTTLKVWMREEADALREKAVLHDRLEGKALQSVLQHLRRLYEPSALKPLREASTSALHKLIETGELRPGEVTTCLVYELNANQRYMGTRSGVVDLHTGALLPPDQGRKALVTVMAPVEYVPGATDPDVDRLLAHLPEEAQSWWWDTLGYHMLGQPSRRFYVVEGPFKGGKSTLAEALADVLGDSYASTPSEDAMMSLSGKASGLSPEMEAFVLPTRWVIADEPGAVRLNTALLKKLSGDTRITWSRKYEPLRTDPVTGTVMLLCNSNTRPKLNLQDPAMEDRVRKLAYPAIPMSDLDPGFKNRTKQEPFREALFAKLVASATRHTPGHAPPTPRYVAEATAHMVTDDIGEVGMFSRRIVRAPGSRVLTFGEVWQQWCAYHGEPIDAREPGGISNRRLGNALRKHVPDLGAPKQISVGGKKARGWRGWQLLDEAPTSEAEQPKSFHAVTYLLLPDRTPMTGNELLAELRRRGAGQRLSTWTSPVLVNGQSREVRFEESAELQRSTFEESRLKGRVVEPPVPAHGAVHYAMIGNLQNGDPRPPDTETASLFAEDEADQYPEVTEAAKLHDGLY